MEKILKYFSFKLLKTLRIIFGILSAILLILPIPPKMAIFFMFFLVFSHVLILIKKDLASDDDHLLEDNYQKLKTDIEKGIANLYDHIKDNNLDEYDIQILGQLKDIENVIHENFETVRLSTLRLKQLSFNSRKYEEKRKDILNSLESDISPKERKYLEDTLKNLLEYKSSVQRLIVKRREIITVIENLYYQIKTLYAKLLNQDIEINKEEPYKKLESEIDDIIKSVEDIEKAKKETDQLLGSSLSFCRFKPK